MLLDWITDPHLDHLRDGEMLLEFVKKLHARKSRGLLITGDIAESPTICEFLDILAGAYQRPIYFVLGNHDYYGAWMSDTREKVRSFSASSPGSVLKWMHEREPVFLGKKTAVVGCDGLYDAKESPAGMQFMMSDHYLPNGIFDMAEALKHGSRHLLELLEIEALECADGLEKSVGMAVNKGARKILVLTHVPPFLEASYFRGRPSEEKFRPWYVNKTVGDRLLELSSRHPRVRFHVFAGHTHGKREVWMTDNLHVSVASARYGRVPRFTQIETDDL